MLNTILLRSPHGFSANCYLISSANEYAVIDPTCPYEEGIVDGKIKYILLTHAHFDHILDIDSWVNSTNAEVIVSENEKNALADPMRNCYKLFDGSDCGYFGESRSLSDGDVITLGEDKIKFIECPGHTIGSAAYLCDGNLFVGDTIFEGGGYGRFDLPTGSFTMLRDSIQKLMTLPDQTKVYPGHGGPTTIKQYKLDLKR